MPETLDIVLEPFACAECGRVVYDGEGCCESTAAGLTRLGVEHEPIPPVEESEDA